MNTLLLIVLCICEVAFAATAITKQAQTMPWKKCRFMVAITEVVLFLFFVLFPGIDLGMRFKILFLFLILRTIWAAVGAFLIKSKDNQKKSLPAIVFHGVGAIVLFILCMIPSYMFADYQGLSTTGSYQVGQVHAILVDSNRIESFETDGSYREVPVYLYYPQDMADGATCPVVFFSHGAFGYYQSNTSTYMELASNGYVVVSIEHPYHSMFTRDTQGKTIIVSSAFMNDVNRINDEGNISEQEIVDLSSEWLALRTADANFAIDTLKESAVAKELPEQWHCEDPAAIKEVLAMCDFEQIGMMGHSLGGATSVELGRIRNDIDAVVDFDGTMLGEVIGVTEDGLQDVIRTQEYTVPILSFDNMEHHEERMRCMQEGIPYANNVLLENATQGYATCIAETGHMNYTDLPLFAPALANMLGTGSVDPQACVEKMNEITLSFFNKYLKGEGEFSVDEYYELSES